MVQWNSVGQVNILDTHNWTNCVDAFISRSSIQLILKHWDKDNVLRYLEFYKQFDANYSEQRFSNSVANQNYLLRSF